MGARKIKIVFSYIAYPVAMPRYMLEALLRRTDVEVWVAGPYTGRRIPWMGGMFLPEEYIREPDLPLTYSMPPEFIFPSAEAHLPWTPDLWIEGNAGMQTVGKPSSCPYVVIATDPHVINYDAAREKADYFYSMQKPYMKAGDRWLPYGYDPIWHRKTTKPFSAREYDIALVGLPYPDRKALMHQLRAKGYSCYLENGPAYEDAWEIYNNSKVGLNLSSLQDTCARVFEIMAMRCVALLNRVPDQGELFREGEEFFGFGTIPEAIQQFERIMKTPVHEMDVVLDKARAAVIPHSWDTRMEQVLKDVGLV